MRAAALLLLVLALPPVAAAQQVDASKLGVSLERIQRELRAAEEAAENPSSRGPLKLDFQIQVFGQAPPIDVFGDFPLDRGPVPYGGPTHRDVLDFLTPQEFRSPTMPLWQITTWATQKLWDHNRRRRCEDELEEYRRQVMAGMRVSAPTCAR